MRIAMLGTRGVPASYGGFETCVEQLGSRLVRRGHEVTVYCRSQYARHPGGSYLGMRLVKLPTVRNKYLDTFVHTFLSSLHAIAQPYDICLYFIAGNSPLSWIPRPAGKRTILHVDGLDWKRDKWPPLAKKYIQLSERLAAVLPNTFLTDSKVVQKYYQDVYGAQARYIAYGSEVEPLPPGPTLRKWGLEPRKYILFVGRLVPENAVHHLTGAFEMLADRRGMKCVIVGDSSYADDYVKRLKAKACEDVVFTGYLFGEGYRELSANAYCFVETSGVGGTHPALLEAMGFGNCVVAHDTPENRETMGGEAVGFLYDGRVGAGSLQAVLQDLIERPDLVAERRALSTAYVRENYSWEAIADQYEDLFYSLLKRPAQVRSALSPEPD